ncbi:hypothetical protein MKW94_018049 [Papaver nudicaule]|uniref:ABC transporter domain-containing protein n=1 Tax=Papaver nudicaule TaxID=74823 RepID=A0AA41S761_PAPNU|nr:hypothetical protein [Papaver nudicaule]
MGSAKVKADRITSFLLLIIILCRFSWHVQCQLFDELNQTSNSKRPLIDDFNQTSNSEDLVPVLDGFNQTTSNSELVPLLDQYNRTSNPELLPLLTKLIYKRLSDLTSVFQADISRKLAFCIKDQEEDWNGAFNFMPDLDFLSSCIEKTKGDISQRLCTAAETKFYFSRFLAKNYLKPNKNCNLTTWNAGCEPGWACRVDDKDSVDLKNSKDMPARTSKCQSCCAGFFCPHGLTCMIPCPLGAYCPLAELNKTTSTCEPYRYQLPPKQPNHTCGGADSWADISSSSEIFCSAGSYCPSTTKKVPCSDGHYCRTGSRSEKKCFKLTSCDPNTATQGLRLHGAILIAALSALLIIIYNCSDHVLAIRERRNARSREAAARSVQGTAHALKRWKTARDVAKKHALGLQKSLSSTLSRQKTAKQQHKLRIPGNAKSEPDEAVDSSRAYQLKSSKSENNANKGSENPTEITDDLEANFNNNLDFSLKSSKKHAPKGKHMHTNSQIFKYVYEKIEKEKALQQDNKKLTFSGLIKRATETEFRTRPPIEISFRDLTLTLKGKNKHLMRCVTGKIMPGRVSAVMGPSGAGKTTFLNALAGKATGCKKTGLILINGNDESIHSYKKIIGFVPQDDIVHGNLTVEENLMFSAKCRLSADMPKADKVLIIERVIDSLGLQHVRGSLVGTVENRGISGGQRKRVNVGLEMVMEPSLLILDEPTSGLDSSSSQLLLRALRREALEGVNICTVVHQPSYSLFKMFDDLILLAKGGFIVYHGPVKEVEEYFAGLGVIVPDRVNPPDHFIDLLEGIVPSTSIDMKQFPLRWMLHKGYPIPPDMQLDAADVASSSRGPDTSADVDEAEVRSLAGDIWEDVKCNVEIQRDNIHHNFLMLKDLSNRRTPGVFKQYKYYLGRISKQRLRESRIQAVDFLILFLAGTCLGLLAKVSDENFGAAGYTYTVIAVSLLCKIAALRSFSTDKLIYWRESSSGMSSLAYFLAKDTVDHFNTLVKPVVYLSMFYFFNNPRSSFMDYYVVLVFLVYCVTGIAYMFAIFLEPGSAQLWSVLLPVVLTLVSTQQTTGFVKFLANLCYPKWALQAFVISNAESYSGVWLITRCGSLMKRGYDLRNWNRSIIVLFLYGAGSRILAYFLMYYFHRYIISKTKSDTYLKPNANCNLRTWNAGCEPGWACRVDFDDLVDLKNLKHMPTRASNCHSCCEGFFCPEGLTCMIPCPLGSYCPLAELNTTTSMCDPHYCRTGSRFEKKCFKFTSCNLNTATQGLRIYGALLIAALSALLIVFYNCCDHVLTIREKRNARSREAAARSVQKTTDARTRKPCALGLQKSLPRTFGQTDASARQPENIIILSQARTEIDEGVDNPRTSQQKSSDKEIANKKIPGISMDNKHDLEGSFNSNQDFSSENSKTHAPMGKHMHTTLQHGDRNLTFSGVIEMATKMQVIITRPMIEISFRELTLTLKGKNKYLMRCVTGNISPGRVSAVMGPSGAGKTTFLNALAGKATGCKKTGLILINGENESIHSYTKIIGFVPQDDIVHGNLTVEENLMFSANCRLSADMPKADKVLIFERVIDSLGLHHNRGISGGQRKRVNVGMEMVMEPSLLLLDEPTSGLDSSSSQLLLRALRREALEGVNICMVVHQPSYNLFKMFDDLILLAKGGLMVYNGPVKKVEQYFAGLGVIVPDRVNPPDYFIDVLEGIVPSTSIDMKQLPLRWILHKGYPIPRDMQLDAEAVAFSYRGTSTETERNADADRLEVRSFAGDFSEDAKSNAGIQRGNFRYNSLILKDLSNRHTPGVFEQYKYYLGRVSKQRLRESKVQGVDLLILFLAGACLGLLAKVSDENFGVPGYTYTVIAVSLLCKIAALRSFSPDRLIYWRESSSGMSSLAYFLAKDTVDHFNTLVKPVVYLSMFYFFNNPRSSFMDYYTVLVILVYCVTGIAYVFSIFVEPGAAQLVPTPSKIVNTFQYV